MMQIRLLGPAKVKFVQILTIAVETLITPVKNVVRLRVPVASAMKILVAVKAPNVTLAIIARNLTITVLFCQNVK